MKRLNNLLENNKAWAKNIIAQRPDFFEILSKQQSPEYLWIGCSDSRVPASEIVGLMPPMIMEFYVKDVSMLDGLKVGDVVDFTIEEKGPTEIISEIKKK